MGNEGKFHVEETGARFSCATHPSSTGESLDAAARCIHSLIESQVRKSLDKTAVIFGAESITYRQLDSRANMLAQVLSEAGVGPDKLVAVHLDRCIEMVVALLAMLGLAAHAQPMPQPQAPKPRVYVGDSPAAQDLLEQARSMRQQNRLLDAVTLYQQVIERYPDKLMEVDGVYSD